MTETQKGFRCPQCGSERVYKDGLRYLTHGATVQRWHCRKCGYRFSEQKPLQNVLRGSINSSNGIFSNRQVCDCLTEASKNLATVETRQEQAQREGTLQTADVKGKIVECSFWLLKQGYSKYTIQGRTKLLKRLAKLGDILNPESIKEVIAKQEWSTGRKVNAVDAYTSFLQMQNARWEPPQYRRIRKLPFIPTENEVD